MAPRWRRRFYRPCEPFMTAGALYGRSRLYPWRAYRTKRIFATVIRVRLRWATANTRAFNQQAMHPVFAWQWQPTSPKPPPAKVLTLAVMPAAEWREAA
jgi:hypothetical protein